MFIIKSLFIFFLFFLFEYFFQKEKTVILERVVVKHVYLETNLACNHSIDSNLKNYRELSSISKKQKENILKNKKVFTQKDSTKQNTKMRLKILSGYGFTGDHSVEESSKGFSIRPTQGFVFGIGLDYKVNENYSLGIQYQSNQTTLGSIGYDF